jgi:hypothetical protein
MMWISIFALFAWCLILHLKVEGLLGYANDLENRIRKLEGGRS